MIIANRQQSETEQHMLMVAQRENDSLCRENKLATKQLNELIEDQRKTEVKIKGQGSTNPWPWVEDFGTFLLSCSFILNKQRLNKHFFFF